MRFKNLLLVPMLIAMMACTQVNFSALKPPTQRVDPTRSFTPTMVSGSSHELTPTPDSPSARLLSVCLVNEPRSLFLYDAASSSEKSVLEAVYDGPIDIQGYNAAPVILEKMPSLADGDALLRSVAVNPGDLIVDANGDLTNLGPDVLYRPVGCTELACAQTYSGTDPVHMDQLVVHFKLLPDLQWSDGTPLTAADSLYSYEVARSLTPMALPERINRTSSYNALDKQTVEWIGVPGFVDGQFQTKFFSPLPQHAWVTIPVNELSTAEASSHKPLGWGPYVIEEWVPGDHISLHKNPLYFRTGESLPYFDYLVYRFVDDATQAVDAIIAGECNITEETFMPHDQETRLSELQKSGTLLVFKQNHVSWEQITFGINSFDLQRPQYFAVNDVRQAVAMCIDRTALAAQFSGDPKQAADLYIAPDHPLYNSDATHYTYDPQASASLLTAAGWLDTDNDPSTARVAQSVKGVADGTSFVVQFLTSDDDEHLAAAQLIQADLKECGIQLNIDPQPVQQFLAAGPDGPVFGRAFDLAQFAWSAAQEPPCYLYLTSEIPGPYPEYPKGWGGDNASGFSNPDFDRACKNALFSLPDSAQHSSEHRSAQEIFSTQLPAVPLYFRSEVVVARPDLCNFAFTSALDSAMADLEVINYGSACSQ